MGDTGVAIATSSINIEVPHNVCVCVYLCVSVLWQEISVPKQDLDCGGPRL